MPRKIDNAPLSIKPDRDQVEAYKTMRPTSGGKTRKFASTGADNTSTDRSSGSGWVTGMSVGDSSVSSPFHQSGPEGSRLGQTPPGAEGPPCLVPRPHRQTRSRPRSFRLR